MVSVLFCWIIVSVQAFLLGFAALTLICRKTNYTIKFASSFIAAGLVVLSVYAEIFSLFYKVGSAAFILSALLSVSVVIFFRKDLISRFKNSGIRLPHAIVTLAGLLLFSFASSRGYMHYDTALYHSQFIRWIEEYGVVKGLALFHFRFGYNSAAYPLQALFSFSWTGLQPMHCMAGYFLFLLFMPVCGLFHIVKDRKIFLSDFVRIGIFYYITLVMFEVVAPASDFFATSMVFFVVYHYVLLAEKEEKSPLPFALLSLLALYAVTLKLSAGFMAFLVIKPAVDFLRRKQIGQITLFVSLGLLILLPMMIRGYIISGYPLYPSTFFSILHPDWQVHAETAHLDAAEIRAWGQKLPELGNYEASFTEWFPYWFRTESFANRLFLIADALSVLCIFTVFPFFVFRKNTGKSKNSESSSEHSASASERSASLTKRRDFLLLLILLCASFFLWFTAAPLIRYGYAFVILPCLCAAGFAYVEIIVPFAEKRKSSGDAKIRRFILTDYIVLFFFLAVLTYKSGMLLGDFKRNLPLPFYITAIPYEEYETESYEMNGITFYKPVSGDRTGYNNFPAAPYEYTGDLRGNTLKEGFTNPK